MGNDEKTLEFFKNRLDSYRKVLDEGKSVIILISRYQKRFDKLAQQLGDGEDSLQKIASNAQTIIEAIKQNQSDSISVLEQSTAAYEQIKALLATKGELETQISSTKSSLVETSTDIEQKKAEISTILAEVKKLSENANAKHDTIQEKLAKILTLELKYEGLIVKLSDPKEGIAANIATSKQARDEVLAVKEEGQLLLANITQARDSTLKSKEVVETAEKESTVNKNKIAKHLEDSQEYKNEIAKILSLASDSSLATAFKERKNTLKWTLIFWGAILILAVLAVSIPLIRDYAGVSTTFSKEEWFVLFLKFLVSAPLGLLALFAGKQYTSERLLQEKYAFKETVSRVHKAHVLFLIEKFPKKLDDIFDFTKDTVCDVLTVPFDNKQTKIKFGLGSPFFGKFLNFTGEVEDMSTLANQFLDKDIIRKLVLNGYTQTEEKTKTTVKTTTDEK